MKENGEMEELIEKWWNDGACAADDDEDDDDDDGDADEVICLYSILFKRSPLQIKCDFGWNVFFM